MKKIKKIYSVIQRELIKKLIYINEDLYMTKYIRYLKKIGINIIGTPKFISQDVYFDGNDYSKITIGDNVTISREVMFLTHDYSITTAYVSLDIIIKKHEGEIYFTEEIEIGDNCFIGARASLLPGTVIGNNVIIGAGSVVKGKVPDNSIVAGNPYRILAKTNEWAENKIKTSKFAIENSK